MYAIDVIFDEDDEKLRRIGFEETVKKFDGWLAIGQNRFLVLSDFSAKSVCSFLSEKLLEGDQLLILEVGNTAAWVGIDKSVSDWLERTLASKKDVT